MRNNKIFSFLLIILFVFPCMMCTNKKQNSESKETGNWYTKGFYFLHYDHHVREDWDMGKDTDPDQIRRLLDLARPDAISLITKGNTGYTTYPTKVGFRPPHYYKDMVKIYRDAAAEHNIPFIAYYNPGRDKYIMEHKPEWNKMDINGKLQDRAICYNTPVVEEYLLPQVDEIMDLYHPAGWWMDGTFPHHYVCFCEECKKDFRKQTGLEPPDSPRSESWSAYKKFNQDQWRQFVHKLAERIHAKDPDCLIACAAAWYYSIPEKPDPGYGFFSHDFSWPGNVYFHSGVLRFWDTQGLPYDVMTTTFLSADKLKPFDRLAQEMAVSLSNGGRFYAWDNPSPSSGLYDSHIDYMGRLSSWLRSRQPYWQDAESMPDVSVLEIAESHYLRTDTISALFPNSRDIPKIAKTLSMLHMHAEILADWRLLEGPVRGSLLILNDPLVIPDSVMYKLDEYVNRGGSVLLTAGALKCDVSGIAEFAGVEYVSEASQKVSVNVPGMGTLPLQYKWYNVRPGDAEIILSGEKNVPFLTRKEAGPGAVWYCAVPMFEESGGLSHPDALRKAILDIVLPESERRINVKAPEWVEVSLRKQESPNKRYIVHLVNMSGGRVGARGSEYISPNPSMPVCTISVRVPQKPAFVTLEPGGREPEYWEYSDGNVVVRTGEAHIHEMVVLTFSD